MPIVSNVKKVSSTKAENQCICHLNLYLKKCQYYHLNFKYTYLLENIFENILILCKNFLLLSYHWIVYYYYSKSWPWQI